MIPPKVKHPYKSVNWAFMRWCDIESGTSPGYVYLRRLRIFLCPWFGIYLHRIYEADTQKGQEWPLPHSHPRNFYIWILKGGYEEVLYPAPRYEHPIVNIQYHQQGSMRRMGTSEAHFIRRLFRVPTWTLTLVGRKQDTWYFFTEDGQAIDWKDFNRDRGVNSV